MNKNENQTHKGIVMVVDDTRDNIRFLADTLKAEGYTIRPFLSGEPALEAIEKELPDIILLDIMMPGMDGYRVCRELKANERSQNIPVIFISALDDVSDKVKGFAAGGVDFITKPFQVAEVLARIDTHLALRRLQRTLERKNRELENALAEIKTLQGFIPICSNCKSIRDDTGYWQGIEEYIQEHSDAEFSHSICPDCIKKLYPEIADKLLAKNQVHESEC